MKILITDAFNLTGDSLLRVMKNETHFDIYLLSERAKEPYLNGRIKLYPTNYLDFKSVKDTVYSIKPDVIINNLEFGDIHNNDRKKMQDYNVLVFDNICSISRVLDCRLITISNEFVFDGKKGPYTEQDKPGAINYFGNTKHAMENACLTNVKDSTIVRIPLLYGFYSLGYKCLTSDLISLLKDNREYVIKENYMTTPCFSEEFAYAVVKIIEKNRSGIYHVSGTDYLSLYDFVLKFCENYELDFNLIKIANKEIKNRYGLVNYKSETDLGVKFSSVNSGLTAMKFYIYGEKLLPL